MHNMEAGIGDCILRYPELIESLSEGERVALDDPRPYVAIHLNASRPEKIPPHPYLLVEGLVFHGVSFRLLDRVNTRRVGSLRYKIEVAKRAKAFIGTLSCFNVVAQLAKVPSFVIVNRSIKEPFIYSLMQANGAVVEEWNNGQQTFEEVYAKAIAWAKAQSLEVAGRERTEAPRGA